jgi:hypothetical protein
MVQASGFASFLILHKVSSSMCTFIDLFGSNFSFIFLTVLAVAQWASCIINAGCLLNQWQGKMSDLKLLEE